jgi:hypothetical protein
MQVTITQKKIDGRVFYEVTRPRFTPNGTKFQQRETFSNLTAARVIAYEWCMERGGERDYADIEEPSNVAF